MTVNLPRFLLDYREIGAVIGAEEPEFKQLWDAAGSALYNQFIGSADEKGIDRFEKLLGNLSESGKPLEERRARALSKWLVKLPYTFGAFRERVSALCGEDFTLLYDPRNYSLKLNVHLREYGRFAEIKRLVLDMLPANIYCNAINSIVIETEAGAAAYSSPALYGKRKKFSVKIKEI